MAADWSTEWFLASNSSAAPTIRNGTVGRRWSNVTEQQQLQRCCMFMRMDEWAQTWLCATRGQCWVLALRCKRSGYWSVIYTGALSFAVFLSFPFLLQYFFPRTLPPTPFLPSFLSFLFLSTPCLFRFQVFTWSFAISEKESCLVLSIISVFSFVSTCECLYLSLSWFFILSGIFFVIFIYFCIYVLCFFN